MKALQIIPIVLWIIALSFIGIAVRNNYNRGEKKKKEEKFNIEVAALAATLQEERNNFIYKWRTYTIPIEARVRQENDLHTTNFEERRRRLDTLSGYYDMISTGLDSIKTSQLARIDALEKSYKQ